MSWQEDFVDCIVLGAPCPVCGFDIVKVDYPGYSWRCSSSPPTGASVDFTTAMAYGRATASSHHTALDFIRKIYSRTPSTWQATYAKDGYWVGNNFYEYEKRSGWAWEDKKEETENEFGPVMP